ncbi:MAG: DUF2318 domain-containing protein [Chloroflexi bacterium]|nr:DUF2318 domain-containing protein [Chloroflexota bacterium]
MMAALAITLREGMEAALVLGIILAYLRRTGRASLNRYAYWGLGLAVLVSLAAGISLQLIGFDPENEVLEGTLMAIGGVFVATMVVWMWKTARDLRRHMETRMENIVGQSKGSRGAAIGILAFSFFMVAREGVEMVLFLAAATLGEADIVSFLGGALGIALASVFAVLFVRGSLRINLSRFFTVTAIVLLVLALRLMMGSVHEFAEVGIVPMAPSVMKVLGFFLRDRTSSLLLMGMILVPILLVLWDFRRAAPAPAVAADNAAERRKLKAARRWENLWRYSLSGATLVIMLAMASQAFAASPFIDPPAQPVAASTAGDITLSTAGWQTGELHKFSYAVGDAEVRFLAAKLEDGAVATSLDACQVCGVNGYMQEKDGNAVICKRCNAPIPMGTMGEGGGCNPLPLASRTQGDTLIIPVAALQSHAQRFQ